MKPVFTCNNFFVLRSMVVGGDGFAVLPPFLASDMVRGGQLVPALRDWVLDSSPIQVVLPNQRDVPLRVKKFIAHLTESLGAAL